MVMAFDLSVQRGHCAPDDADRLRRHLAAVGLPTGFADLAPRHWDVERLIGHMSRDKKVSDARITFVLARGIGEAYPDAPVDQIGRTACREREGKYVQIQVDAGHLKK